MRWGDSSHVRGSRDALHAGRPRVTLAPDAWPQSGSKLCLLCGERYARKRRVRSIASGLAVTFVFTVAAESLSSPANLRWQAPRGCPAREAVQQIIAAWIGQPPAALDLGPVSVDAVVSRSEAGWVLDLAVSSPTGSDREVMTATQCETLVKIVALKVSLAVDPLATIDAVESIAERPAEAALPPAQEKLPIATQRAGSSWGYGLRGSGGLGAGVLPSETPAVAIWGSLRSAHLRIELGSAYWFRRSARFGTAPAVGAELDLWAGAGRICPVALLGEIEVPLCAGAEVGVIRAAGFGTEAVRTVYEPWLAVVIGPALSLPLTAQLHFWLETDAVIGVLRPGFSVRHLGHLHRPQRGAAQVWTGLEVQFD